MQATATAPAQAPVIADAPAARRVPAGVVVTNVDGTTQTLAIPLTKQDVADIRERRSELSDQLTSAAGRRRRLAEELMKQPEGPARAGIEGRLVILDRRLAQLETDIAATGRQLSAASPGLIEQSSPPMEGDMPDNVLALSIVFTLFILAPLALTLARNLWRRGSRLPAVSALPPETSQRLERLEQGVEAIAIEIERVSEGQRFVTKLLAEGQGAARLPAQHVDEEIRAGR